MSENVAEILTDEEREEGQNIAGQRIKAFIERVERLEEEKKAIAEDIKEVYGEAQAMGFETKILRKIVSIRKKNLQARREENELLELYMASIGMEE